MTETKHTPAPYIDYQLRKEVEKKLKTVNFHLETFGTTEETISKTRLYKAAPELLEALVEVMHYFENTVYSNFDCANKARAAIAKARGEL